MADDPGDLYNMVLFIAKACVDDEADGLADEVLQHDCTLVYAKLGSYQQAARRLQIDRRTVRGKIDQELLEQLKAAPR